MDLEDSTVINGFPSTSLINSIVASYLVNVLNLDQICGLDSDEFPPVSMIYDSKPKFPARIYADEKAKIVVFLSEFTPYPPMARNVANTVLSFAEEAGCSRIISPETQILDEDGFKLFGIGSTDAARKAEATREDINIGTAINSAIRLWLDRKRAQAKPVRSFLELEAIDFGPGTENLSEEHDKYLYGE